MKKWIFSREKIAVWIRIGLFCILAVACHFMFLSSGQQTMQKQIFSWMRLVCFLGVLWQCFLLCDESNPAEKIKEALFRFLLFVGNGVGRVLDFFFGMTQSARGRRGIEEIKGFQEQTNSIAGSFMKRWRKPKYKKWKHMNNKEKIRFLYYKSVSRHSKKDIEFSYQKTAWEIYGELEEKNRLQVADAKLFHKYNEVRYRKGTDVTDEEVKGCQKK